MFSEMAKNGLLAIAFSVFLTNPALAEERYYPTANHNPLAVGSEEFKDNYASLAGLEGVQVITKFVTDSASKYNLPGMKPDLVEQIEKRLTAAGLRMLSEEEVETTPGQPTLSFYPAYSGNDIDAIKNKDNPTDDATSKVSEHDCCRSSIWASFQQSSGILRNPNKQYKFATWGTGDDINSCENRGAWTYDAVLKVIDNFVADYKKAEAENEDDNKPKLVSVATEVPQACGQAWLMNLSVFDTNQTQISDAVKPILDELAETASHCKAYKYTIETHADQRADASYNRILSEARALAIKDYLLSKKISYDRLTTIAYGESKPLTSGTTEKDHAINRRVVIIPQLDQI